MNPNGMVFEDTDGIFKEYHLAKSADAPDADTLTRFTYWLQHKSGYDLGALDGEMNRGLLFDLYRDAYAKYVIKLAMTGFTTQVFGSSQVRYTG